MKPLLCSFLILFLAVCQSCSNDSGSNPNGGNKPPVAPSNPQPAHQAQDQDTSLTLRWTSTDPDGDSLYYDVYFGEATNPSRSAAQLVTNSYIVPKLAHNKTYFWKVSVSDSNDHLVFGPLWSFSTTNLNPTLADPQPANGAHAVTRDLKLEWRYIPGFYTEAVFDVYFGPVGNAALTASGLTATSWTPNTVEYGVQYQWQVKARNGDNNIVDGPIWTFTVRDQLSVLGSNVTTPRYPTSAEIVGGYLYSGTWLGPNWTQGALYVFDISNPSSPTIASAIYLPDGYPEDMAISGTTAYIVHSSTGLSIVDISNPLSIRHLTIYDYSSSTIYTDVSVFGNYAYLATSGFTLILDISSPQATHMVKKLDNVGGKCAIYGNVAFAFQNNVVPEIAVIDISNPTSASVLTTININGQAGTLYVNYPYLFCGRKIFSINSPTAPVFLGELPPDRLGTKPTVSVCWSEGTLAVASITYTGTLYQIPFVGVIDFSDPANPLIIAEYQINSITDVACDGNIIVVTGKDHPGFAEDMTGRVLVLQR